MSRPAAGENVAPERDAARGGFAVLVASDGSEQAKAAVEATAGFCWPPGASLHGVVVRDLRSVARVRSQVGAALDAAAKEVSESTLRALRKRWPEASVAIVEGPPAQSTIDEAKRVRADVIVVGSRGHGRLGRLLLGSTSRALAREAPCPVLIVKAPLRRSPRVLLGSDGSAHSREAAELLARLAPPAGARVTLLSVLEPLRTPSLGPLPASIRSALRAEAAALAAERERETLAGLEALASLLDHAGWKTSVATRKGIPLPSLLAAAREAQSDLLVLGARGVGGLRRLLLGSVAEGALDRSPLSLLIVRQP
jgi:nucleotide-binding universal stress UspA family protein